MSSRRRASANTAPPNPLATTRVGKFQQPTQYSAPAASRPPQYGQPQPSPYINTQYGGQPQPSPYINTQYGGQPQPSYSNTQYGGQPQPSYNNTQYGGQPQPSYNNTQYGGQPQPSYSNTQYGGQPPAPVIPKASIGPSGAPAFSLQDVVAIVDQRLSLLEAFMARFNEMEEQVLPESVSLVLRAARELSQQTFDAQEEQPQPTA